MSRSILPNKLFPGATGGVGDLGTSFVSVGQDCQFADSYSVQVVYPAAWNGTWTFEVSNNSTDGSDGNWSTRAPDAAFPASDAGAGNFFARIASMTDRWIRLRFARTSGSGNAAAYQQGKGTG